MNNRQIFSYWAQAMVSRCEIPKGGIYYISRVTGKMKRIIKIPIIQILGIGVCLIALFALIPMGCGTAVAGRVPYVCQNGTPVRGSAPGPDTTGCRACNDGFTLDGTGAPGAGVSCVTIPYVCANGTPTPGGAPGVNSTGCQVCNDGYTLDGDPGPGTSCEFAYTCENGAEHPGVAPALGALGCGSCDDGYALDGDPGPGTSCGVLYAYTCQNGTETPGGTLVQGTVGCDSCNDGYTLDGPAGPGTPCGFAYTCDNGGAISTIAPTLGAVGCNDCASGYQLGGPAGAGTSCVFSHVCDNGDANPDAASVLGDVACQRCNTNYVLEGTAGDVGTTCIDDSDNDLIADRVDVDDDNDGLIEINSLVELNNVRYNLAGTSYDDEEADTGAGDAGDTTGAPTAATANCAAATNGVYLCGYELATDLDFDRNSNGSTIDTAIAAGFSGALDAGDAAAPYFAVDANNRGGWVPIGPGGGADAAAILANSFNAIFEGNNNTISNLASIRDLTHMGLFGRVGANGHIRNLGLIDVGISTHVTSANSNLFQGGALAGRVASGTVTGCYATGTVFAGGALSSLTSGFTPSNNETEAQGGLVGILDRAVMVASHADVDVIGDSDEREALGGLVGISLGSTVIASYAAGDVDASTANTAANIQYGGGLIAAATADSRIIASYASGAVTVVPPANYSQFQYYGGLVGRLESTPLSAGYSTGNVNVSGGDSSAIRYAVGGFVGNQIFVPSVITASYSSGNVTANVASSPDDVGKLIGIIGSNIDERFVRASYGFGTLTGEEGVVIPLPAGVSTAAGLNADNAQACNNRAYTTRSACESATLALTPGTWAAVDGICTAPPSNPTADIDYAAFSTQADCEASAKTAADIWTTWSSAADYTLDAWVFADGVAPKLRYADYDGASGTVVDCNMFPAVIPGTDTPLVCGPSGSALGGQ